MILEFIENEAPAFKVSVPCFVAGLILFILFMMARLSGLVKWTYLTVCTPMFAACSIGCCIPCHFCRRLDDFLGGGYLWYANWCCVLGPLTLIGIFTFLRLDGIKHTRIVFIMIPLFILDICIMLLFFAWAGLFFQELGDPHRYIVCGGMLVFAFCVILPIAIAEILFSIWDDSGTVSLVGAFVPLLFGLSCFVCVGIDFCLGVHKTWLKYPKLEEV